MLFRNLVKISFQHARTASAYQSQVLVGSELKEATRVSFLERLRGRFSFTQQGTVMRAEIRNELSETEMKITTAMASNKADAIELLKRIGGNIFLLKSINVELLKEFEKEIVEAVSEDSGIGCWSGFDQYAYSFDSSCSSDGDWGGDSSGCGGDSGCSSN